MTISLLIKFSILKTDLFDLLINNKSKCQMVMNLFVKIQQNFFQAVTVNTTLWIHRMDANKISGKKAKWDLIQQHPT